MSDEQKKSSYVLDISKKVGIMKLEGIKILIIGHIDIQGT